MFDKTEVERVAGEVVREHGAELITCAVHVQHGITHVRLVVDKKGGILLDECARINKGIGHRFDVVEFEDYTVEVASPGLDRTLTSADDFQRVIGQSVHCFFREPLNGKTECVGTVESVAEDTVTLMTPDQERYQISVKAIAKAKLEIRW